MGPSRPAVRVRRLVFALLPAAALLLAAGAATAEEPSLRSLTPPGGEAPTLVDINLFDLQVFRIEEQEEVFQVGGRLTLSWIDPRQAYDPEAAGTWRLEYQGEAALDKLQGDVWGPDLEFVNAVGSRDRMSVNLTIDSDGEIWYRERFNVLIKQDFYLGDFPYDAHTISFALEPFTYDSSRVQFVNAGDGEATAGWEPTEWVVGDPLLEVHNPVGHRCVDPGTGDAEGPFEGSCAPDACSGGTACEPFFGFARATVSMDIARVASHYNGNIILPLALIVLVAGSVFWMSLERTHLGDRLALSFTSLLTIVAFDFVTSSSLPKLWYSTVLDRIVTTSYVFLALNIAASLLVDQLHEGGPGRRRWAERLHRHFRWAFPAVYLAVVGAMAGWWL